MLADRWMEIYRAKFYQLRVGGYTEDQATLRAGKLAYEECDRLSNEQPDPGVLRGGRRRA